MSPAEAVRILADQGYRDRYLTPNSGIDQPYPSDIIAFIKKNEGNNASVGKVTAPVKTLRINNPTNDRFAVQQATVVYTDESLSTSKVLAISYAAGFAKPVPPIADIRSAVQKKVQSAPPSCLSEQGKGSVYGAYLYDTIGRQIAIPDAECVTMPGDLLQFDGLARSTFGKEIDVAQFFQVYPGYFTVTLYDIHALDQIIDEIKPPADKSIDF
jgi:hypothetical protein